MPDPSQLLLPIKGLGSDPPTGLTTIPRRERVFVNRNLRLAALDWIGFDMDYTLATYRQEAMDTLSVKLTAKHMIARGYPHYLEHLEFKLVRESLTERAELLKVAPYLVAPTRFLLPIYNWQKRQAWFIQAGLALYDLLSIGSTVVVVQ